MNLTQACRLAFHHATQVGLPSARYFGSWEQMAQKRGLASEEALKAYVVATVAELRGNSGFSTTEQGKRLIGLANELAAKGAA